MDSAQELNADIADYMSSATTLEVARQGLVDRVTKVVREEIIPELNPLLPDGYSFIPDYSEVKGNADAHKVPTGFQVVLRLCYNGESISQDRWIQEVGNLEHKLKLKLEELAEKYNLEKITPAGPPIVSG